MEYDRIIQIICDEGIAHTEYFELFSHYLDTKNKPKLIECIMEKTNCSLEDAQSVCDWLVDGKILPGDEIDVSPEQTAYNNAKARELLNKPKCPTCGSTNVKKISLGAKVAGVSLFGVYSHTYRRQFECKNCGYEW